MSDQQTYVGEMLLEDCLDEVFHGGPSPDLAARILKAGSTVREPAIAEKAIEQTGGRAFEPILLTRKGQSPSEFGTVPSLPRWAFRLAQVAVAAGIVILLLVLVMPRDAQVPSGVVADNDAEFEFDPAVKWPEIQADAGWYLLSDGAPPLTAAGSRVEDVQGQVIVKVGDIPNPDEQAAMQPWLAQHQVEAQMSGNWIKAGALSLLIVTGSAFVDGQYVSAEKNVESKRNADKKEVEKREADKKEVEKREGEKKDVERKEGEKKEESIEDRLARLREEIADLEARLEKARAIEDEEVRAAKIERIENALKDKRDELAKAEERAAGDDKKRDDDGVANKRREDARRKNAEKDAEADADAQARREDERRKNAERDAETDEERKAREEAERKKREDAGRSKERKSERKQ